MAICSGFQILNFLIKQLMLDIKCEGTFGIPRTVERLAKKDASKVDESGENRHVSKIERSIE